MSELVSSVSEVLFSVLDQGLKGLERGSDTAYQQGPFPKFSKTLPLL